MLPKTEQLMNGEAPLGVTHFHRWRGPRHFSIERLFSDVRSALPEGISCRVVMSRFESRGVLRRLYNMLEACGRQTQVNHVTGDTHYLTLLMSRRSTVLTIPDCICLNQQSGWRRAVLRLLWFELPIRRAAVVTTISESSKREILKYTRCAPDKIKVIPACVSADFRPMPKEFNAESPLILQIGTAPNKNIERLVAALSGLRCRLLIIGTPTPSQWSAIRASGVEHSVVGRLTSVEMVQAYADADIVALVSTYEGFGLPIVEANAVGRPVVTGNVHSMPEVAADAACLVDPHDVQAIRAGFLRVIGDHDYRNGLIEAGYRNARRFSRATVAQQYAAIYESVAPARADRSRLRGARNLEDGARPSTNETDTRGTQTRVLAFLPHYLPGEKSGGPARSIANLIDALGDDCSFSLVTSDRDLGSATPYENVRVGEWTRVGKARVLYLPRRALSMRGIRSVLTDTPHDVLYLNGVLSDRFSIVPMVLRKLRLVPRQPVIIASRGEFSVGALALKRTKKWAFLTAAELTGLYRQPRLTWQASSSNEDADIRRVFADGVYRSATRTNVVPNLTARVVTASDVSAPAVARTPPNSHQPKAPGQLNVVFLSRISPMKNLAGLLSALMAVQGHVRLTVYGPLEDPVYWAQCGRSIEQLPSNVEMNYGGVVPHDMVGPTLSRYHLFAFPTFGENFGHVIAEALMAGCPVLTTDATPWAEIETTGAGSIVSATDTAGITAALQHYVDCDQSAWLRTSRAARALGERRADNPETIEQNRALFVNAAREAVA